MPTGFRLLAVLCIVCWIILACQQPPENEPPSQSTPCFDASVPDATQTIVCSGRCVDPRTDSQHCGGCNQPCPQGCTAGTCSPPLQLAVGERHSCVRLANGNLRCWGANDRGQLGDGSRATQARPVAAAPTLGGLQSIAAGGAHTCAIASDRTVLCWGANDRGQLGLGNTLDRVLPATAQAGECTAIALGFQFSCALTTDRRVLCWGANERGQLGDGNNNDRSNPAPVPGLSEVVAIAAGRDAACALRSDHSVWCWGSLNTSQNVNSPGTRPFLMQSEPGAVDLAVGDAHVCVRTNTGTISCRGSNRYGQLGTGLVQVPGSSVSLLNDATAVFAAGQHSCALSEARGALCWGKNSEAQLGDETFLDRPEPTSVMRLANANALAIGSSHGCAIVGTDILCWGRGSEGQLGDGFSQGRSAPVSVRW